MTKETISSIIQWAKDEADKAYQRSWDIAKNEADSHGAEFRAGVEAGRTTALQEIVKKLEKLKQ